MELHLESAEGKYHIHGYGLGYIQINNEKIAHSVIITPDILIHPWAPQSLTELNETALLPLFNLQPTVVLLGTGPQLCFPNPALLTHFYAQKIGVEIMDTAAACRTYTVLMSEGRKVAGALLIC